MGINPENVKNQIAIFERGDSFIDIVKPATKNDGILVPDEKLATHFLEMAGNLPSKYKVLKFVPASGAATRMFKSLFNAINENSFDTDANEFISRIQEFAFFQNLQISAIENGDDVFNMLKNGNEREIIDIFLNKMDYGLLPKGLLAFHSYDNKNRTSVEEHLAEGAEYAKNADGTVFIHLTVSPEHAERFKNKVIEAIPGFEKKYGVKYHISWSVQKPSTDTIAVDLNNNPFRDNNGLLVFRPGGHGALIENLNELDADFVFIKNIDNVVPDRLRGSTVENKKLLLGLLLDLKNKIDIFLQSLDNKPYASLLQEIVSFFQKSLFIEIPIEKQKDEKYLKNLLNRPIRVCGMVRNQGEPGGGPFFVKEKDGSVSLQIVESSQIDLNNPIKKELFSKATHFNPVDLLCYIKDNEGNKFNLLNFVDHDAGFISEKSKDGKPLKAYELPGLWNGAMAKWNTVFLEVPLDTFNPVKTINDLLRDSHKG